MTNEFQNIVYFIMSLPITNYSGRLSYYIVLGLLNIQGIVLLLTSSLKLRLQTQMK